MAMVLMVRYPGGEVTEAIGYPARGSTLVVNPVPRGPEAAYGDIVEFDLDAGEPYPVTRVVGGPRRPTTRVRVGGSEADIDRWLDAREREGWDGRPSDLDPNELWMVAIRDDLGPRSLALLGATIIS